MVEVEGPLVGMYLVLGELLMEAEAVVPQELLKVEEEEEVLTALAWKRLVVEVVVQAEPKTSKLWKGRKAF